MRGLLERVAAFLDGALLVMVPFTAALALGQVQHTAIRSGGLSRIFPGQAADSALLRFLPSVSSSQECTGSSLTGTKGQALTFTRASSAYCTKSDGTMVLLSSNQPRLEGYGLLVEEARTNLLLQSRDLSNASWTKTNMTCTKTATGPDGVANSASTCTSSAANGTVAQTVTVAAAARTTSLYIKRRTGSGNIDVARDGAAFTTLSATQCRSLDDRAALAPTSAEWVRCELTSTQLNPAITIRFATSGDAVDIDHGQDEAGSFGTSPIVTAGTSATRAVESPRFDWPATAGGDWSVCASVRFSETNAGKMLYVEGPASAFRAEATNLLGTTFETYFTGTGGTTTNAQFAAASSTGDTRRIRLDWTASTKTGRLTAWTSAGVSLGSGSAVVSTNQTDLTYLYLGARSSSLLHGHISNVAVYSSAGACQ